MKRIIKGFTLAEVLITLTVIGIIAAISIPALNQSINEKAWNAQRKALHTRISAAVSSMPKITEFGEYKVETIDGASVTTDTAAESFLIDGLSKVYKMSNICGPENLTKCGLPETLVTLNGSKADFPKKFSLSAWDRYGTIRPSAAAFQTVNGEAVAVYYNPNCTAVSDDTNSYVWINRICVNFVYDLNGPKSPNQVGKDIGYITAVYRENLNIVAPNFYPKIFAAAPLYSTDNTDAASLCKKENKELKLASLDDMIALGGNYSIGNPSGYDIGQAHWTSNILSPGPNGQAATFSPYNSPSAGVDTKDKSHPFICVYE